jgi:hypothetical protein
MQLSAASATLALYTHGAGNRTHQLGAIAAYYSPRIRDFRQL